MAINIETPTQELQIFSSRGLVFAAIVFLIFSAGIYILLLFLIGNAERKVQEGSESLKTGLTQERKDLETNVLRYQKKTQDIIPLLERHNRPSVFFDSLEKVIHPAGQITKLSFDPVRGGISLDGLGENFETLAQQAALLKKEDYIKNIRFSRIQRSLDGKIVFSATLDIDPDFIKDK